MFLGIIGLLVAHYFKTRAISPPSLISLSLSLPFLLPLSLSLVVCVCRLRWECACVCVFSRSVTLAYTVHKSLPQATLNPHQYAYPSRYLSIYPGNLSIHPLGACLTMQNTLFRSRGFKFCNFLFLAKKLGRHTIYIVFCFVIFYFNKECVKIVRLRLWIDIIGLKKYNFLLQTANRNWHSERA